MEAKRIAIALVIFLVGSSTAAFATNLATQNSAEVPEKWGTVAMMGGDSGEYRAFEEGGPDDGRPYLQFAIGAPQVTYGATRLGSDTIRIEVNEAGWQYDFDRTNPQEHWQYQSYPLFRDLILDRTAMTAVGIYANGAQQGSSSVGPTQANLTSNEVDWAMQIRIPLDSEYINLQCGLITPLQGQVIDTNKVSLGECKWKMPDIRADESPTRPASAEYQGSEPTPSRQPVLSPVGYLDSDDVMVFEADGMTLWFRGDNPYPVQIQLDEDGRQVTMRLTNFERGSEPLAPTGQDGQTLPFDYAPRAPHGLDETGIEHAYPASRAYEDAQTLDDVSNYVANHPGAYVYDLAYFRQQYVAEDQHTWEFKITDGTQPFGFRVTASAGPDGTVPPSTPIPREPGGLPRPLLPYEPQIETWVPEEQAGVTDVAPADAPQELPDVATLFNIYEAHFPGAEPPGGWFIQVADGDDGFVWQFGAATAGFALYELGDLASGQLSISQEGGYVLSELTGETMSEFFLTARLQSTVGPATPATPGAAAFDQSGALPLPAVIAAAGGVGAALAILYLAWPHLKIAALGLFSRVRSDQLLNQPTRQQIHDIVAAEPGLHLGDLVRRTETPRGTVEHHVRKLVDSGLLVRRSQAGYTCYYPRGTGRAELAKAGAVQNETARSIMARVKSGPVAQTELAVELGINRGTVSHHVKRLEQGGLVQVRKDGRRTMVAAS